MDLADMVSGNSLNLFGRVLVAFYFLWAAIFNVRTWDYNLSEFERIGLPGGPIWLASGILLQTVGSLLFVLSGTVLIGAVCLCLFVISADVLFHRFWTYPEKTERTMHLQFLTEHVALLGGIVGIASGQV